MKGIIYFRLASQTKVCSMGLARHKAVVDCAAKKKPIANGQWLKAKSPPHRRGI